MGIFIDNVDEGIECTLSKFADDTKLGQGMLICLRVGRLFRGTWTGDQWAKANCMTFNTENAESCP